MPVDIQFTGQPVGISSVSEDVAEITIVDTDDQDAIFDDPAPSDNFVFTEYTVISEYVFDPHIVQLPAASPGGYNGQTAAFVQLAAPTCKLIVEWTVSREGDSPDLPSKTLADSNAVFMLCELNPEQVEGSPDGSQKYTCSGRYTYGFKNANAVNIGYPITPIVSGADLQFTPSIEPIDFADGVIDGAWLSTEVSQSMFN